MSLVESSVFKIYANTDVRGDIATLMTSYLQYSTGSFQYSAFSSCFISNQPQRMHNIMTRHRLSQFSKSFPMAIWIQILEALFHLVQIVFQLSAFSSCFIGNQAKQMTGPRNPFISSFQIIPVGHINPNIGGNISH